MGVPLTKPESKTGRGSLNGSASAGPKEKVDKLGKPSADPIVIENINAYRSQYREWREGSSLNPPPIEAISTSFKKSPISMNTTSSGNKSAPVVLYPKGESKNKETPSKKEETTKLKSLDHDMISGLNGDQMKKILNDGDDDEEMSSKKLPSAWRLGDLAPKGKKSLSPSKPKTLNEGKHEIEEKEPKTPNIFLTPKEMANTITKSASDSYLENHSVHGKIISEFSPISEEEKRKLSQISCSAPSGNIISKDVKSHSADDLAMKDGETYKPRKSVDSSFSRPHPTVMHKPGVTTAADAASLQASLRSNVVDGMCSAVANSLVGPKFSSTPKSTQSLNPLHQPVFDAVKTHFNRMPPRYALSVSIPDVSTHMKLLTEATRSKVGTAVHVRNAVDEEGVVIEDMNEVMVVCRDRKCLLTAITVALASLGQSIVDADIVTTTDGYAVDRFVVTNSSSAAMDVELIPLESKILKSRIEMQLLSSLGQLPPSRKGEIEEKEIIEEEDAISLSGSATTDTNSDNSADDKVKVDKRKPDFKVEEWSINFNDLRLKSKIGSGRSGISYLATWNGMKVAAKMMDLKKNKPEAVSLLLSEFFQEVAVVSKLQHPNICRFLGAAIEPPKYCVVFEFMEGGDLYHYLRTKKKIDYFMIALDIAQGMHYMHLSNFIHRDLKSGNLLLTKAGNVKITDFGLSRFLDQSGDMTAETGTYRWMAPEVIRHEPYTTKADVYSYAMVLFEMLTRSQPFSGLTPVQAAFAVAREDLRPGIPSSASESLAALIKSCWQRDPAARPSFEDILRLLQRVQSGLTKKQIELISFKAVK